MRIVVLTLVTLISSACTYIRTEGEHISHPLAGPPFGDRTEEDSLNQANACAGIENRLYYSEVCLGYVIGNGGFFGPRLTTTVRIGKRWELKR